METKLENNGVTNGEQGTDVKRAPLCVDNPLLRRRVVRTTTGQGKISPTVIMIIGLLVGGFWLANYMLTGTARRAANSAAVVALRATPDASDSLLLRLTVQVNITPTPNVVAAPVASFGALVTDGAVAAPARVARRDGGTDSARCIVYGDAALLEELRELNSQCEVYEWLE